MIKAWFFDIEGNGFSMEFETIVDAERFATNHGLEMWKSEPIS